MKRPTRLVVLAASVLLASAVPAQAATVRFGGSMKGKIQVPLTLAKSARKITLTLSSAPADGTHKFVVQRKVGNTFTELAETTATTFVFNAPDAGTYTFRSALQKNRTTAPATFFSPTKSITVT